MSSGEYAWNKIPYHQELWFQTMKSWKSNIVRIPFDPNWITGTSANEGETYLLNLDKIVAWAEQYGMYCILDCHRNPTTENAWVDMWKIVAQRYKNRNHVLYGIFNEINKFGSGYAYGSDEAQVWTDDYIAAVRRCVTEIRAITDQIILVCGSEVWGQDARCWASNPVQSHNIAYDLHAYVEWTGKVATVEGINEFLAYNGWTTISESNPVFIGECGAKIGANQEDWLRMFLTYMTAKEWSFTVWSFNPVTGFGVVQEDFITPHPSGLVLQEFLPAPTPTNGEIQESSIPFLLLCFAILALLLLATSTGRRS